jgi:hypothetical protein
LKKATPVKVPKERVNIARFGTPPVHPYSRHMVGERRIQHVCEDCGLANKFDGICVVEENISDLEPNLIRGDYRLRNPGRVRNAESTIIGDAEGAEMENAIGNDLR